MTPLRLAVVGHTNTGKTSLLRTLARRRDFGEVSPSPATTRRVEPLALLAGGEEVAVLLDTPGLEDSIGLLEAIDSMRHERREDPQSSIERFLASEEARRRFPQEVAALEAARGADLLLVVIDARDRVRPRHLDELEVLRRCGRPVVPVLNFVAAEGADAEAWRGALARLGLHAVASFDVVVYDAEDEARLLEAVRTLAADHRDAIDRLLEDRRVRRDSIRRATAAALGDLLVDAAALVVEVMPAPRGDPAIRRRLEEDAGDAMRERLRTLERRTHLEVLALAGFDAADAKVVEAALSDLSVGIDLFSPEALRAMGLTAATGAAAGAATGAAIDLAVGGLSLGAAAAIGAVIGGALGAAGRQARRLLLLARGGREVTAGDPTLLLLLRRGMTLVRGLESRGHAALEPLAVGDAPGKGASRREDERLAAIVMPLLREARTRLGRPAGDAGTSAPREDLRREVARAIEDALRPR